MRQAILFFLFSFGGYSDSEEPAGLVWLGHNKGPTCGGILIEPDVVISAKSCLESYVEVIWPFKSEIRWSHRNEDANLAILFLARSWPKPVEMIHVSEVGSLKKMLNIHFSNEQQSVGNWIHALDSNEFMVFYGLEPPLIGSPVWSNLGVAGLRAIGMVMGSKTALRLDPYFNYITTQIQADRSQKQRVPAKVVIPALTTTPMVTMPAQVVAEIRPVEARPTEAANDSAPARPPVSLGCSCSQVRRGGFFGRQ